jgi:hypothetical protein
MLEFVAPGWLWVPPLVAVTGLWGLWRGQRVGRPVSSVRLWKGLAGGETTARRRVVDPLWLMVFIATLLAALGLAGPQWAMERDARAGRLSVDVAVRDVGLESGQHAVGAWLKVEEAQGIAELVAITLATPDGTFSQSMPLATLKSGWTYAVDMPAVPSKLSLDIRAGSANANDVLFRQRWARPGVAPFGVLELGTIDPMLRRAFQVHPGARFGDPTLRPAVVLINQTADPAASLEEMGGAGSLMIAGPSAPFPGIEAGGPIRGPEGGWRMEREVAGTAPGVRDDPRGAEMARVFALRPARLSSEWQILARAGGHPFLALARGKSTRLWLAAELTPDTDWWKYPSFIIFFGELVQQVSGAASADRIVTWVPDGRPEGTAIAPPTVPPGRGALLLGPWMGIGAMALLVGSAVGLVWRGLRTAGFRAL